MKRKKNRRNKKTLKYKSKFSKCESFNKEIIVKNIVLIRYNLYNMKNNSHNKNKEKKTEQWEMKYSHNTLC